MIATERSQCRACEQPLEPIFKLGNFAINAFPRPFEELPAKVPLELTWCPACSLVQLRHTTPPDLLFRQYYYRSGVNEQMRTALLDIVEDAVSRVTFEPGDWVIDIGANDGTLLRGYTEALLRHPGQFWPAMAAWEPAENLIDRLTPLADLVVNSYFPTGWARIPHRRAKIITSIAMVYDLEDPNAFLEGIRALLHKDGIWIVQFSDLLSMLRTNDFPTICHEHLEYYSLTSFMALVVRHDLEVVDVSRNDVNGGSLRCIVTHPVNSTNGDAFVRVLNQWRQESALTLPLHDGNPLACFAEQAGRIREQLQTTVHRLRHDLQVEIDGYGAATKGNILLQYCGFGPKEIRQIAERSDEKVGRQTITGIPIVSEGTWRWRPAPVTLVPIWPFRAGILAREHAYLEQGGQFLFPLPHVEVVHA